MDTCALSVIGCFISRLQFADVGHLVGGRFGAFESCAHLDVVGPLVAVDTTGKG
jgi:hypothetical protein